MLRIALISQYKIFRAPLKDIGDCQLNDEKLKNPLPAAQLREHTHLKAKCDNTTRWSSTAAILDRSNKFKEHIPKLDVDGLVLPSYREGKHIEVLWET